MSFLVIKVLSFSAICFNCKTYDDPCDVQSYGYCYLRCPYTVTNLRIQKMYCKFTEVVPMNLIYHLEASEFKMTRTNLGHMEAFEEGLVNSQN